MEMKWNSERLTALIDRAGISQPQLAQATGISLATIHAYCIGKVNPGLSSLIALADFFAVPLDYLCGRCTEEQAQAILDNYNENFMALRRAPHEAYLVSGRKPLNARRYAEYESPWPYNLVDAIIGKPVDWVLTEDHLEALDYAMRILSERERKAVLLYYQHGMNLEDTSREFNVTRERIRQIILKAIKKMRHPSYISALCIGLVVAQDTEAARSRLKELETQIDCLEKKLAEHKAAVNELSGFCAQVPNSLTAPDTSVFDLGLSVRATNCLWRAGYDTLGKVTDAAEAGQLKAVRNLGMKSLEEILTVLYTITGKNYRGLCV